jgi:hypothetical protein
MFRRITALAAGAILALGLAVTGATTAHATTGTCTNIATPIAQPVGCGGVFLPLLGSGIQPDATSLTLTAASDAWNAQVTVTPYNPSDATQDFTVYQVCQAVDPSPADRTASWNATKNPCGTASPSDTPVIDPVSGFGEYVAEITPLGQHVGGALNSLGNLCLSVQAVRDGPRTWWGGRAIRWHAVLRTCNTFGANFTAGVPLGSTDGHGVPGVVNLANRFQTWSPIPAAGGYVLGNNALSSNFANHPFVLDARGGHGPQVLAFPENDGPNEIWKVAGCTAPITSLTPGFFSCP